MPDDSLNKLMEKVVKRYSSLFWLPSDRKVLLLLAVCNTMGGLASGVVLQPTYNGIVYGLTLGIAVFLAGLSIDYVTCRFILRRDTIYNMRRTMALSLFSWCLWLFLLLVGAASVLSTGYQNWWFRLCLLGFSAVTTFRMVVFSSTSDISRARTLSAALLEPFACVALFIVLWIEINHTIPLSLPIFLLSSVIIGYSAAFTFLYLLDRLGRRSLGVSSLSLFRAFMLNWVLHLNAPFEQLLEEIGERKNVDVSLLQFVTAGSKVAIIVPSVHPGPFKNIGSSLLPSLLKGSLEKELGYVACVPHGLLGHEFDLASQQQNHKIIERTVVTLREMTATSDKASPFVKATDGLATASCQLFGGSALISFTLAPKTIEDLPEELGLLVRKKLERVGLHLCAVVNAHNSINGTVEMEDSLKSLEDASSRCVQKVASTERMPFEVGAATVCPGEFRLEDGMGAGGITVAMVKCGIQKAAYVVIDGNNMVSGLREEILSSLRAMGVDEGEVFTTDTHSVSAIVLGGQGYHPIGEAMDKGILINHIKSTAAEAIADLRPAKVSCGNVTVTDVTVIGEKQLERLCVLIEKSVRRAKRIVAPIFLTTGAILMSFLLLV